MILKSKIKQMQIGYSHVGVIDDNNYVHCWGTNTSTQCDIPEQNLKQKYIQTTNAATCVLKEDGSLLQWGTESQTNNVPQGNDFVKVVSNIVQFIQLRSNGTIEVFGDLEYAPDVVSEKPTGNNFIDIFNSGGYQQIQLESDNTHVLWGHDYGKLNFPNDKYKKFQNGLYIKIAIKEDDTGVFMDSSNNLIEINEQVIDVQGSLYHVFALLQNGTIIKYGNGIPQEHIQLPTDSNYIKLQSCLNKTFGQIKNDGTIALFGENNLQITEQPTFEFNKFIIQYLNNLYTINNDQMELFPDNIINIEKFNSGFININNIDQYNLITSNFKLFCQEDLKILKQFASNKTIIKLKSIDLNNFLDIQYIRQYLLNLNLNDLRLFFKKENEYISLINNKILNIDIKNILKNDCMTVFEFNNLSKDNILKLSDGTLLNIYIYNDSKIKLNNISLKGDFSGKYRTQSDEQDSIEIYNNKIKLNLYNNDNYRIRLTKN